MKKKLMIATTITLACLLLIILGTPRKEVNNVAKLNKKIITTTTEITTEATTEVIVEIPSEEDILALEMRSIEYLKFSDKKEYFLEYKNVLQSHERVKTNFKSIYDYYSAEDLDMLFRVVEVEAEEGSFLEKANVASVIFNRIDDGRFGDGLIGVLFAPSQFSSTKVSKFHTIGISEDTILACEYAFAMEDTTDGCLYFDSCSYQIHSGYATYTFTDAIGHKFYK